MSESPRKGSLLVIFLTVFVDLLGFGMVLPLLPVYADRFEASGWQLGLLMASFSAMQFLFSPMWGRLSDQIGRRPVLMIGLAGSIVFYTLFALAAVWESLPWLFVSRIGAGIAGATISTAQAYIADSTSLEKRPKGMALIGMAFGMGFTFGPLFGFLAVPNRTDVLSPMPGYAAAGLSALALAMAVFWLPESKQADSESARAKIFDFGALREATSIPSIGLVLFTIFLSVFAFANCETTLSLLMMGGHGIDPEATFGFSWKQVCLTFAYIGFVMALVQGGVVRRLAGRVSEAALAITGAVLQLVGFTMVFFAASPGSSSSTLLYVALAVVVSGFAFISPNLNSLLSRRSDPARQGMILGVGQRVSSLARIVGSGIAIPLLKWQWAAPYVTAGALMLLSAILIALAAKRGADFAPAD